MRYQILLKWNTFYFRSGAYLISNGWISFEKSWERCDFTIFIHKSHAFKYILSMSEIEIPLFCYHFIEHIFFFFYRMRLSVILLLKWTLCSVEHNRDVHIRIFCIQRDQKKWKFTGIWIFQHEMNSCTCLIETDSCRWSLWKMQKKSNFLRNQQDGAWNKKQFTRYKFAK